MTTNKRTRNKREDLPDPERIISECIRKKAPSLQLSGLALTHLPEQIRPLTWLERLDVQINGITKLPSWIGELHRLNALILWANPLQALPRAIGDLQQLRQLILGGRPDSEVAGLHYIAPLKNLEVLGLPQTGLRTFPEWILELSKLESLHLFGNRLTSVPSGISNLRKLIRLSLYSNLLEELPASLLELKNLDSLEIHDNPLPIPPEIISSKTASKILSYYFRTKAEGTAQPLNEFKLILVGRGGVGKTTLVHRLITDKYKEFKRTPGIKITKWPLQIENNEVRAHVWDFGGQEIMHGTHRFFMTERALYLVLSGVITHRRPERVSLTIEFGLDD